MQGWLVVWLLLPNHVSSERRAFRSRPILGGVSLDRYHYAPDAVLILAPREMPPAGERIEGEGLAGRIAFEGQRFLAQSSPILLGAVKPVSNERVASGESLGAVDTWPVSAPSDEAFLDTMAQEVAQAGDLGRLFLADDDGLVAASPNLVSPTPGASHFLGDLGIDESHEACELPGVVDAKEQVIVVREDGGGANVDAITSLGTCERADNGVVQCSAGLQQKTAVNRPARDFDEGSAFGDVA